MPSFNPQLWQQFDLKNENQSRDFLKQLSNWCIQMQQPQTIAGLLNGGGFLNQTALSATQIALGTITTDQTVNANSTSSVVITLSSTTTQTRTLTINNLAYGSSVFILANVTVGTLTLKIAATLPGGTAYSQVLSILTSTLALTNMATGLAIAAVQNSIFFSMSEPGPSLIFYNS